MKLYVIKVGGLLHHVTSVLDQHEAAAAQLAAEGHVVTTEMQP